MIILEFEEQTRVLGAPKGWDQKQLQCGMLPIADVMWDGVQAMVSYWKPTPEELAQLNAGAHIQLSVVGTSHPPVSVDVARCKALIERAPSGSDG